MLTVLVVISSALVIMADCRGASTADATARPVGARTSGAGDGSLGGLLVMSGDGASGGLALTPAAAVMAAEVASGPLHPPRCTPRGNVEIGPVTRSNSATRAVSRSGI